MLVQLDVHMIALGKQICQYWQTEHICMFSDLSSLSNIDASVRKGDGCKNIVMLGISSCLWVMCSCGFIEGGVHHSWLMAEQYLHAWLKGLYVQIATLCLWSSKKRQVSHPDWVDLLGTPQPQVNCCCGEVINLGSVELANANRLLTFLPSSN